MNSPRPRRPGSGTDVGCDALVTSDALGAVCGTRPLAAEPAEHTFDFSHRLRPTARVAQRLLRRWSSLPPRNITIGRRPRFVWYRVAKAGTRSVVAALHRSDVDFVADHPWGIRVPPALLRNHFSFAFVRDPRSRLVSCWSDKVLASNGLALPPERREELRDFGRFVEFVAEQDLETCDPHLRLQTALIDLDRVDFVGRVERFRDDFGLVCSRIGIPTDAPHLNPSDAVDDPYSSALRRRVEELYAPDLDAFSY